MSVNWNEIPKIDAVNIELCLNCRAEECSGCGKFIGGQKIKEVPNEFRSKSKLGADIRSCRQKAGISRALLARMTGISKNTLSRWESGLTRPSEKKLKKVCEALNAEWLMRRLQNDIE